MSGSFDQLGIGALSDAVAQQGSPKRTPAQLINCDQVAWIGDIFDRYRATVAENHVSVSRAREAAKVAAILELMEILNLGFQDATAAGNVIAGLPELHIIRQPRA